MKYSFLLLIIHIGFILTVKAQQNSQATLKGFDLSNAIIPLEYIKDGGPPRDGIPSIDKPAFIKAREAGFLSGDDLVLGVYYKGKARAYPVKILNYHEIVNDVINDHPLVITFCPLCGSGMIFDAEIKDERKTFGVSGLLYNSDVLLYDRQTESLWSQILGKAVAGPLVNTKLEMITARHVTWKEWKREYPDTEVLSTETGYPMDYSRDPYPGYYSSEKVWFDVEHRDSRYHPKTQVLGVEADGRFKAYPFPELEKSGGTVTDRFNDLTLKIEYNSNNNTAVLLSPDNKEVNATTLFWFAWIAFHPGSDVYTHDK